MKKTGILFLVLTIMLSTMGQQIILSKKADAKPKLLTHLGKPIFLSGMNLAWMNFANDLDQFDEAKFIKAVNKVSLAGGNCIRWWLHVNGSKSPLFDPDGYVTGISPQTIPTLKRALDLAAERGVTLILTLWSFDMLQKQGQNLKATKMLIQEKKATRAYIQKALIPMVQALKGHPALLAWEICNEPEGMSKQYGSTGQKTSMEALQQFVNLIAGAIHREDRDAKVTNGSIGFQVVADGDGLQPYYDDEQLVDAGGDRLGYLDFYQIHYFPQAADEKTSPFHHPANYWKLDKPILIGAFPAKGCLNLGKGYRPKTTLTSEQCYQYALQNGYAGVLGWAGGDSAGYGDIAGAASGMKRVRELSPQLVAVGNIDRIPLVVGSLKNLAVEMNTARVTRYGDLTKVFYDLEDQTKLKFSVRNTAPDLLTATIESNGKLGFRFYAGEAGMAKITVNATDSAGHTVSTTFKVYVIDPQFGNIAVGKPVVASTFDLPENQAFYINDSDLKTRWSSKYTNNEWIYCDLLKAQTISRVKLNWGKAYANEYKIQVSDDARSWQTVYTEAKGDGGVDEIRLSKPANCRYVRMLGVKKATKWGFSLQEMEIYQ